MSVPSFALASLASTYRSTYSLQLLQKLRLLLQRLQAPMRCMSCAWYSSSCFTVIPLLDTAAARRMITDPRRCCDLVRPIDFDDGAACFSTLPVCLRVRLV
jgi:hypothetical protein